MRPNTDCISSGGLFYTKKYSATWLLLYYHDFSKYGPWPNTSLSKNSNDPNAYSIIDILGTVHKKSENFEFLLDYPEVSGYNRWSQSLNPFYEVKDSSKKYVKDYKGIHISWTGCEWGGLFKSTLSISVLDGSYGINSGYFVIGRSTEYSGAVPGPCGNINKTRLWIRVPHFLFCTRSLKRQSFVSLALINIILLMHKI